MIPKWARRDFDIKGSVTIWAGDKTAEPARRKVATRPLLSITLEGRICERCNNVFLGRLEQEVRPVLSPMMLQAAAAELDPSTQELLSTWAVKTVLLLELAVRQHYPDRRPVPGYVASELEFAWIWKHRHPPPRSFVWLGCWDSRRTIPVKYEPSGAPLPTADGFPVEGHLTTLSLGYVVFQVFTADFVAAERHGAPLWNTKTPRSLDASLARVWPNPTKTIAWPGAVVPHEDWARLVTWDGVLRPGDASPIG